MNLKRQKFSIFILSFLVCLSAKAQVVQKIGNNSMTIDASAVLELESTTKGFLPPRMTDAQLNAIPSPAFGLFVFNTTSSVLQYFNGIRWISLIDAANSALVTGYTCSTASAGSMNVGTAVSGVTQTITATVTGLGTYAITTTAVNGVTFAASGVYTATGAQNVVLTASGTPTADGTFSHAISGTPTCSFSRDASYLVQSINYQSGSNAVCDGSVQTAIVNVTASSTGKIWMDRNLGASRAATSATDQNAYGGLYQWGRGNDGHASINWASSTSGTPVNGTRSTLSATDAPGYANFITASALPYDWRNGQNNNLWQGAADGGINNPCPSGYRLPTDAEYTAEFSVRNISNSTTAASSGLKLPVSGFRSSSGGFNSVGSEGYYWTSTVNGTSADFRVFNSSSASSSGSNGSRAAGCSVRCLKL